MGKVKIVTDSTADIPAELLQKYQITVIPLKVMIENETYQDGVNLTPEAFYNKLDMMNSVPATSQPTPFEFETMYQRIREKAGEEISILSIHLSSAMSGTIQSAVLAAEAVKEEVSVEVVDSLKASYAVGILVVEAAKLAAQGAGIEGCRKKLEERKEETSVYFLVDTLEYLQKNGRIGRASALIGSLLKMKPVLSLNRDGEVYPYRKARGKKKAVAVIQEALEHQYGTRPVHIGVSHAQAEESGQELLEAAEAVLNSRSSTLTKIGSVIGSHTGRGTVSVAVTPAE
ncbi:DegV family protein [Salibacterium halotolerans]|uniref:EDD domain protein, DegV family n=1 Tax=Salibacterium halotolerans TaxID=1884432 RepID=A0A1I5M9N8_9BACI|nr:DegV family protein [Salibacterium halotolerans]SFP06255.1 EDD domain protein, DegV family [Salibacterium halotolerans]